MAGVPVISPDGERGEVPEENLQAALQRGFQLDDGGAAPVPGASPEAAPAEPRMVRVRSPEGDEGMVPETSLAAALERGFTDLDAEESYGSAGQRALTAVEGGARGASLGASDAIEAGGANIGTQIGHWLADAAGMGVPRAAERGIDAPLMDEVDLAAERSKEGQQAQLETYGDIQGRREANPVLATTTEIAGAAAPALVSGGVGSVGAAARLTPAGQLANLATKMGATLSARAATGIGRIGALAATGAAEAAVDATTRRVMDDLARGDVEITAERMLESAWDGARMGALLGGGLGALAEGGQALARGAKTAYGGAADMIGRARGGRGPGASATAGVGGVADDIADAAPGLSPEIAERAIVDPAGAQEAMGPLTSSALSDNSAGGLRGLFEKARAAEGAFEAGQQGATRTVRKDLDMLLKHVDEIDELAGIAAKRKAAAAFDGWGRRIDSADALGALDSVDARISGLVDEVGEAALMDRGGLAVLKRSQQLLKHSRKTVSDKLAQGDIGAAYMALDDLKRGIGHAQNTKNTLAQTVLREEYDKIRLFMEDQSRWGELAEAQKRVNPAWAERIRRQNDQRVGGFFVRSGEASIDPFEALKQANDASVGSLLNQLGKAESEGTEEALRRYLRSVAIDAETRASTWGTRDLVDKAAEIKGAVDKIESSMNAVALLKRDANGWNEIKKSLEGIPFAGATLGAGARAMRGAANAVEHQNAATLYRLARGAVKSEKAIEQTVEATMQSLTPQAARAVPLVARAVTRAAIPAASVQRMVAQAQALQDPESPESHQLEAMTLQMAGESPEMADALKQAVMRKATMIVQRMGPATDPADPLQRQPMPMDRVRRAANERFMIAVADPRAALDRLGSGIGSPEDLAVVRELIPNVHKRWADGVLERVVGGKVPLSASQRNRLLFALGRPVVREQTPEYVQMYQNMWRKSRAGQQHPQPQQASAPVNNTRDFDIDVKHWASRADQLGDIGGVE